MFDIYIYICLSLSIRKVGYIAVDLAFKRSGNYWAKFSAWIWAIVLNYQTKRNLKKKTWRQATLCKSPSYRHIVYGTPRTRLCRGDKAEHWTHISWLGKSFRQSRPSEEWLKYWRGFAVEQVGVCQGSRMPGCRRVRLFQWCLCDVCFTFTLTWTDLFEVSLIRWDLLKKGYANHTFLTKDAWNKLLYWTRNHHEDKVKISHNFAWVVHLQCLEWIHPSWLVSSLIIFPIFAACR